MEDLFLCIDLEYSVLLRVTDNEMAVRQDAKAARPYDTAVTSVLEHDFVTRVVDDEHPAVVGVGYYKVSAYTPEETILGLCCRNINRLHFHTT